MWFLMHKIHLDLKRTALPTDTQWRYKSKISEKLGRCGRQNMLRPNLKIWDWDWIVGRAVKAIFSLGVHSPWHYPSAVTNLSYAVQRYTHVQTSYRLFAITYCIDQSQGFCSSSGRQGKVNSISINLPGSLKSLFKIWFSDLGIPKNT